MIPDMRCDEVFSGLLQSRRYPFLDIAKGIGAFLVVLGHNWITIYGSDELFRVIFSFHVPLFFFLSGVLFDCTNGFKVLVLRKLDSILKPYVCILAAWGIVEIIFKRIPVWDYYLGVFYSSGRTITLTPLWFLPHLFLVFMFSWFICKLHPVLNRSPQGLVVLVAALLVGGVCTIDVFWGEDVQYTSKLLPVSDASLFQIGLPFSADIVLVTSAFFLAGHYSAERIVTFRPNWNSLVLSILGFAFLHATYDITLDLNMRRYDHIVLSTAQAALGIYVVLSFSKLIPFSGAIGHSLAYVGSGSLFVLLFHTFFQGRLFSLFNVFSSDAPYLSAIAALFFSVVSSLLVWELVKRIPLLTAVLLPAKSR